eukprot:CAMPEP_0176063474 /NCGR_PEP_ID=MMETSP0120_2-20121206/31657_1 /TAXON_ID=160619 /ORGANISM="Kryptoperidinium foliaceum, Strain CCMP 1326" /LENGTH=226 /DNA_ID=CAMNT_0017397047 /DNA_START=121 /DNA_END=799 /DNA_ORIENTATION=-
MASAPKDPGKRLCVRAAPLHRPFPREETCGDLDRQQDHLTTLAADGSRGRLVGDPHRDRHGVPWIMPELEGRLALAMREDHRRLPAEAKERPACRFELRRQLESQGVGPRVALGLGAELGEKPGPAELEGELPQSRRAETVVVVQAVGHRLAIQQHRQVPARGILGELRDCPSDAGFNPSASDGATIRSLALMKGRPMLSARENISSCILLPARAANGGAAAGGPA